MLGGLFALVTATSPVLAEDSQDNQWHYIIEPYVMFPNVHGTVGIDDVPDASIDESPVNVFNHLQFGAMLYGEAHNNKWAITSDVMYSNLAEDASATPLIAYGRVDMRQWFWELAGLYRLSPWLEAGLGAVLTEIGADINLTLNTPQSQIQKSASRSKTWVDPTIVVRATFPLSTKWTLVARGNVGGFDLSSKFTWQTQLYGVYKLSDSMNLSAGYRAIGDDYESGSGVHKFLYHVTTFGPVIRFAFIF
jgi:hypothetical protein